MKNKNQMSNNKIWILNRIKIIKMKEINKMKINSKRSNKKRKNKINKFKFNKRENNKMISKRLKCSNNFNKKESLCLVPIIKEKLI